MRIAVRCQSKGRMKTTHCQSREPADRPGQLALSQLSGRIGRSSTASRWPPFGFGDRPWNFGAGAVESRCTGRGLVREKVLAQRMSGLEITARLDWPRDVVVAVPEHLEGCRTNGAIWRCRWPDFRARHAARPPDHCATKYWRLTPEFLPTRHAQSTALTDRREPGAQTERAHRASGRCEPSSSTNTHHLRPGSTDYPTASRNHRAMTLVDGWRRLYISNRACLVRGAQGEHDADPRVASPYSRSPEHFAETDFGERQLRSAERADERYNFAAASRANLRFRL